MRFPKKHLKFSSALVVLLVFLASLFVGNLHHHQSLENHNDCSVCAWQSTGSQASSIPTVPLLFSALIFVCFFTFSLFHLSLFSISPSGRSPPLVLL